ncbi:RNA polymerase sigma factor SigM [Nocardioides sp.]|uniref:RNA polymerase sigma factor SigM n=1 Tax=Nocardioides sp. TaxID=35761 RepID=UPI0035112734
MTDERARPADDARDDRALLAAHVDGDPDAFGTLIARHRDRLWAVALRTCADPETAADGLQDAVVAAFRRAGTFRGDAAVTTWLHRIVVNACLDRLRAAAVRRAEPLPDDLDRTDELQRRSRTISALPGATAPVAPPEPEQAAIDAERRSRVHAALAQLSAEQRAAVVLVDMEGYSVAEAAEVLGCAEGTIKSRCSRARARLAGLLADILLVGEGHDARPHAAPGNHPSSAHVGSVNRRGPPGHGASDPSDASDAPSGAAPPAPALPTTDAGPLTDA